MDACIMSMPEVSYQMRADAVLGVLDEYLVFSRANLHSSKGAAIYFATPQFFRFYSGPDFAQYTGWDLFLKPYLRY